MSYTRNTQTITLTGPRAAMDAAIDHTNSLATGVRGATSELDRRIADVGVAAVNS